MSQKHVSWNSPEICGEKVLMSAPVMLPLSTLLIVINQGSLLTDLSCRSVRFLGNGLGNSSWPTAVTQWSTLPLTQELALILELQREPGTQETLHECLRNEWTNSNQYGDLSAGLISATNSHMSMSKCSSSLALFLLLMKWGCWAW